MARSRIRTSRILIVLLAGVLVAGLAVVWHQPRKTTDGSQTPVTLFKAPGTAKADAALQPLAAANETKPPLLVAVAPTPIASSAVSSTSTAPNATPVGTSVAPLVTLITSTGVTSANSANTIPSPAAIAKAAADAAAAKRVARQNEEFFALERANAGIRGVNNGPTAAAPATQPTGATVAAGPSQPSAANGAAANPNVVVAIASAGDPFTDAKAQQDAGNLIAARKTLNDAMLAGSFSPEQLAQAKQAIGQLNDQIIFSPHKFSDDTFADTYVVHSGDRASKIGARHEITTELLLAMNNLSNGVNDITGAKKMRVDQNLKLINGPFNAVVNKSAFTIDLYLGPPGQNGSMFVKEFRVALGKDNSTPPGTWMVKPGGKQKNPKFWGTNGLPPVESGDPKNPLGAYWIALEGTEGQAVDKTGYGIHGTCDPDSIGKQASLGCIRLKNEDVAVVYELLVDGKSTVTVKP